MINHILSKQKPVYFISPHVDDALLSAGALIASLSKKTTVHIITVFSDCKIGESDPFYVKEAKISIARRREVEKKFLIGCNVILHYLDFPELIIRSRDSSFYKQLPHVITSIEDKIKKNISKRLTKIIQNKAIFFCPLGVGGHLDHLIVRDACISAFKLNNIYFWRDYPYSLSFRRYEDSFVKPEFYKTMKKCMYSGNMVLKGMIVRSFRGYLKEFFSKNNIQMPILPESFFYEKTNHSK